MTTYTYERLLTWSREKLWPWQQDALRRVLQGEISDTDIHAVAEIAVARALGAEEPRADPANGDHVRPSGESLPRVAVRGLREIERANALGPGPIVFAEAGLTVIYGDNASGKTGFSRILKKACRARVPGPAVRGNVFAPVSLEAAKATVDFSIDGAPASVGWVDGSPNRDELALVTVFDADCAKWQVDRPNVIEYTPELLAVFRDLAAVFRRVETALRAKKGGLPRRPAVLDELQPKLGSGTSARAFLDGLSADSDPEALARLSVLDHAERERAAELAEVLRVDPAAEGRIEEARGRRVRDLVGLCHGLGALVSEALASVLRLVSRKQRTLRKRCELPGRFCPNSRCCRGLVERFGEDFGKRGEATQSSSPFPARSSLCSGTDPAASCASNQCIEDIEKVDEEMSYCSKFMHDPPGNVSRERPPGPDVVEADIRKLDDWARLVRQRRG